MLSRQVRQAGLLDRRLRYYAWKITLTALALAAGWAAFAVLGDSWWQLGTAVFLAAVFTQIGFLGHDAGHRQIFGSRRANYILGVLCGKLERTACECYGIMEAQFDKIFQQPWREMAQQEAEVNPGPPRDKAARSGRDGGPH